MDDAYSCRFQELKNRYIHELEDEIERLKKIKQLSDIRDKDIEKKLDNLQKLHKILINGEGKRLSFETLEFLQHQLKKLFEEGPTMHRPENRTFSHQSDNNVFNNGPHCSSFNPASRSSFPYNSTVPPTKDNFNPITTPYNNYVGPAMPSTSQVVMNPLSSLPYTLSYPQNFGPSFQSFPNNSWSLPEQSRSADNAVNNQRYSSENIPTIQVSGLDGSRRLSSTLEKTKVLQMSDADVERLLRSIRPQDINTPAATSSPRQGGLPELQSPMPGDTISNRGYGSETVYNHIKAMPTNRFGSRLTNGYVESSYRPDLNPIGPPQVPSQSYRPSPDIRMVPNISHQLPPQPVPPPANYYAMIPGAQPNLPDLSSRLTNVNLITNLYSASAPHASQTPRIPAVGELYDPEDYSDEPDCHSGPSHSIPSADAPPANFERSVFEPVEQLNKPKEESETTGTSKISLLDGNDSNGNEQNSTNTECQEKSAEVEKTTEKTKNSNNEAKSLAGSKNKNNSRSLAEVFGTVDAKKVESSLSKFKIPKKRPSTEAELEQPKSSKKIAVDKNQTTTSETSPKPKIKASKVVLHKIKIVPEVQESQSKTDTFDILPELEKIEEIFEISGTFTPEIINKFNELKSALKSKEEKNSKDNFEQPSKSSEIAKEKNSKDNVEQPSKSSIKLKGKNSKDNVEQPLKASEIAKEKNSKDNVEHPSKSSKKAIEKKSVSLPQKDKPKRNFVDALNKKTNKKPKFKLDRELRVSLVRLNLDDLIKKGVLKTGKGLTNKDSIVPEKKSDSSKAIAKETNISSNKLQSFYKRPSLIVKIKLKRPNGQLRVNKKHQQETNSKSSTPEIKENEKKNSHPENGDSSEPKNKTDPNNNESESSDFVDKDVSNKENDSSVQNSNLTSKQSLLSEIDNKLESQQKTEKVNQDSSNVLVQSTKINIQLPQVQPSSSKTSIQYINIVSPMMSQSSYDAPVVLKSSPAYEKMLEPENLVKPYKCLGMDCSFSSESESSFLEHLKLHEENLSGGYGPKSYLMCAYCYVERDNGKDLVDHLRDQHTFCENCCGHCFYRAAAKVYVEVHQKMCHRMQNNLQILRATEVSLRPATFQRPDRKTVVKPYFCNKDGCTLYFSLPSRLWIHYGMKHPSLYNSFECHYCQEVVETFKDLISHYKVHNCFQYQCLYCEHGSEEMNSLVHHLSSAHSNQPPEILERCIPKDFIKTKSALDQLIIHNVESCIDDFRDVVFLAEKKAESSSQSNSSNIIGSSILADSPSKKTKFSPDEIDKLSLDSPLEKTKFTPDEIDKLPLDSIFPCDFECQACPYKIKIRDLMIQHLQTHLKNRAAPESCSVDEIREVHDETLDSQVNEDKGVDDDIEVVLDSESVQNRPEVQSNDIQELASTLETQSADQEDEQLDPDTEIWTCRACNFKSVFKLTMLNHVQKFHARKYKCPRCGQTFNEVTLDNHLELEHYEDSSIEYTTVYKKNKLRDLFEEEEEIEIPKKLRKMDEEFNDENVEPGNDNLWFVSTRDHVTNKVKLSRRGLKLCSQSSLIDKEPAIQRTV